jgi:hypothetical protein
MTKDEALIRARSVLQTCLRDKPEDLIKAARQSVIERTIAQITAALAADKNKEPR